ncbi:DUF2784 domain-containing protein [Candidatus Sumerlaeota bacterium]
MSLRRHTRKKKGETYEYWPLVEAARNREAARNLTFRICHLLAIGIVVAQAWWGRICPLTSWENAAHQAAGEQAYSGSFVAHWVGSLIYYDAPQWVFTVAYLLFGGLVLASWYWVRPQRRAPAKPPGPEAP